jgi:hypothetical protein
MRILVITFCTWIAQGVLCASVYGAGPSPETLKRTAESVVQVIARDCSAGSKTGSGFVWRDQRTVVTAFHVVAGCRRLSAYFAQFGEIHVTLERALLSQDLALLALDTPTAAVPLRSDSQPPEVTEQLQVIGYYYGVQTLDSRPVTVTLGSSILKDMLPENVAGLLRSSGTIDLSTAIVRIDGNLVPGLSGAPLVDSQGDVVGIGSGGLESGAVGIGWAIQAQYLDRLPEAAVITGVDVSSAPLPLFSAPRPGDNPSVVRCGDFEFAGAEQRDLRDVLKTTDDPVGFQQLAAAFGLPAGQVNAIELAIYTEPRTGASVAVPSEAVLQTEGEECFVRYKDLITIRLTSNEVSSLQEIDLVSANFDLSFDLIGYFWLPNPAYTYWAPLAGVDGLIARRKAGIGYFANQIKGLTFETLVAKDNIFVGLQVTNKNIDQLTWYQCTVSMRTDPGCSEFNEMYMFWAASVLGAHLSTIPPN